MHINLPQAVPFHSSHLYGTEFSISGLLHLTHTQVFCVEQHIVKIEGGDSWIIVIQPLWKSVVEDCIDRDEVLISVNSLGS